MNIFLLFLTLSLTIYLLVGWYVGRKIKSLDDYYVAGRNSPTLLIIGTLVASFMSTNAYIGELGMSYTGHAPLIIIMTAGNCLGYLVGGLFFGRYLRRSKALTVPEFFGARFNSQRLQQFAGITILVGLTCYLLAVTWGVALIVSEVAQINYSTSIIFVWLGYTLFTLYSGSKGVILTDTIMFLLFSLVALIGIIFIINSAGGWFETVQQLAVYKEKPDIISWHGVVGDEYAWKTPLEGLIWALILGLAWGLVVAVSPWQTSRYLMAKNEQVVIRSACGACIAMFLLYLINNYSAAAANLINPEIDPPESVIIWISMNVMPTVLGVILVCGILAAGLSSASTFLSLIGFSATNDIIPREALTAKRLRQTRLIMVCVSVLVVILCLTLPSNIFWITYFAGPVFASSWGAVAFMSIWSKSITEAGAFWGMVSGFFSNILASLLDYLTPVTLPVYLDPILIGILVSLFTIILVSRRGNSTREISSFMKRLHQNSDEINSQELPITLMWPKIMIMLGAVTSLALIFFYAIPYHQALNSSEKLFTSGEFILALSYGLVLIGGGIFVTAVTKYQHKNARKSQENKH